ncbi:MAG: hypothetical protein RJB05_887, partial [Armatimonadota bacterium]
VPPSPQLGRFPSGVQRHQNLALYRCVAGCVYNVRRQQIVRLWWKNRGNGSFTGSDYSAIGNSANIVTFQDDNNRRNETNGSPITLLGSPSMDATNAMA